MAVPAALTPTTNAPPGSITVVTEAAPAEGAALFSISTVPPAATNVFAGPDRESTIPTAVPANAIVIVPTVPAAVLAVSVESAVHRAVVVTASIAVICPATGLTPYT